jgi:hypothetical protein
MGTDLAEVSGSAPRLVIDRVEAGRIMCGDTTFRRVTSVLWSVSDRLAEMDRTGVSHQVISPVPVTMEFAAEPGADPAYARAVNRRGLLGVRRSVDRARLPALRRSECSERLLLGSDQLAKSVRAVDAARYSGALPPDADQNLLARNALTYLGMERPTTVVR